MKKEGKDLTQGNLLKNMLIVFFPLLLTNLLNSIYNFVDAIWIGNIVGENGISVSTNVYPILFLTTAVGYSLSAATSVLISQFYGAKENSKIKQVVKLSVISTFLIVLFFNSFMAITSNLWLKILNTPAEVWNETRSYFLIYLVAYFFNYMLMNIMESLRAIGNTKTPIIFVCTTTILNVVLDPILLKTPLGISGAAVATLIAILIGFIIAIIYVNTKSELLRWNFKNIIFDKALFFKFIKIAMPIMMQEWLLALVLSVEVNVSNETGVEGSASYGVVSKLEQIVWIIAASFKAMTTIVTGQFIGKEDYDGSKKSIKNSLRMASVPMLLVGLLVYLFPYQLCRIFLKNDAIIGSAIKYLTIMGIPFIFSSFRNIFRGFIAGTGHTRVLFVSACISGVIEVSLIYLFKRLGFNNLVALGLSIIGFMSTEIIIEVGYYISNKWKKRVIE